MSVGLESRFNILRESPHDHNPPLMSNDTLEEAVETWLASRYNIRATTQDGRMILWNTLKGSMIVLPAEQAEDVKALLTRCGFEAPRKGIVAYLADRGFLVTDGTNEYRQFQVAFGQQHYQQNRLELILMPSEDCNFRCLYCYEDFKHGTMESWVREAIKRLVRRRVDEGLRHLDIRWFGGEPLYGMSAVEDLAPFFAEICRQHGLSYRSHMTTNGYLLTPEVADQLLAWKINEFQITVDGPPETHDHSRPTRDGQGTFATIFDNLKAMRARENSFRVSLRVNFDRQNAPHLHRFFDLAAAELGEDQRFRLHLKAVGRWGGPNDAQLDVCTEDAGAVTAYLAAEAARRGLDVMGSIEDANVFGSQVCYAARPFNFIIGATGKLMKCTIALDTNDANVVGKISPEGELLLDDDKFALWTEPAFEGDTKCQKCIVVPLCQGIHCPLIRMDEHRSPCTPLRSGLKQGLGALLEGKTAPSRRVVVSA